MTTYVRGGYPTYFRSFNTAQYRVSCWATCNTAPATTPTDASNILNDMTVSCRATFTAHSVYTGVEPTVTARSTISMTIPVEQRQFRATPITRPRKLFNTPQQSTSNDNTVQSTDLLSLRSHSNIAAAQYTQQQYQQCISNIYSEIDAYTAQYKAELAADGDSDTDSETVATHKRTADGSEIVRRSKLSKHAVSVLSAWFNEHIHAPYPSDVVKQQLAVQAGLTEKQVHNWFTNNRKRSNWKELS